MHALRTTSLLSRLVLAWFVLAMGGAGASPLVHPRALEIVCAAGGSMKVVVLGDDGQAVEAGQHTLDCSLCLATTVPPPEARMASGMPRPLADALAPEVAGHIAALVGAPLPARGPPRHS